MGSRPDLVGLVREHGALVQEWLAEERAAERWTLRHELALECLVREERPTTVALARWASERRGKRVWQPYVSEALRLVAEAAGVLEECAAKAARGQG